MDNKDDLQESNDPAERESAQILLLQEDASSQWQTRDKVNGWEMAASKSENDQAFIVLVEDSKSEDSPISVLDSNYTALLTDQLMASGALQDLLPPGCKVAILSGGDDGSTLQIVDQSQPNIDIGAQNVPNIHISDQIQPGIHLGSQAEANILLANQNQTTFLISDPSQPSVHIGQESIHIGEQSRTDNVKEPNVHVVNESELGIHLAEPSTGRTFVGSHANDLIQSYQTTVLSGKFETETSQGLLHQVSAGSTNIQPKDTPKTTQVSCSLEAPHTAKATVPLKVEKNDETAEMRNIPEQIVKQEPESPVKETVVKVESAVKDTDDSAMDCSCDESSEEDEQDQGQPYCKICDKYFRLHIQRKRHMARKHPCIKLYVCDHCWLTFPSESQMDSHCRLVHNSDKKLDEPTSSQSDVQEATSSSIDSLEQSQNLLESSENLQTGVDEKGPLFSANTIKNEKTHDSEDRQFVERDSAEEGEYSLKAGASSTRSDTPEGDRTLEVSSQLSPVKESSNDSVPESNPRSDSDEGAMDDDSRFSAIVECQICRNNAILSQDTDVTTESDYICPRCAEDSEPRTLYSCPDCQAGFDDKTRLKIHIISNHWKQNKFLRELKKRINLRAYRKGLQGYKCSKCSKIFLSYFMYRRHEYLVHCGGHPYMCRECGRGYRYYSDMLDHYRNIHDLLPSRLMYYCRNCKRAFINESSFTRHCSRDH